MNQVTALQYFEALMSPRKDYVEELARLRKAFDDLSLATGGILDLIGERYGELRKGLEDDEYRRIIVGRKIAIWGLKSYPGIWSGWKAVLGETATNLKMLYLPPATVLVAGDLPTQPSELFIQRAGPVVGSFVPAGYQISAYIAQPGALKWDNDMLFWDDNDWAYALNTELA